MENKFTIIYAEKMKYFVECGIFTEEDWRDYCTEYLEYLMEQNKDVLDRLKNA